MNRDCAGIVLTGAWSAFEAEAIGESEPPAAQAPVPPVAGAAAAAAVAKTAIR
jgi:hypothetical protein